MALVSFESVASAAESLTQGGGKASVRAVITVLGGGSPNAVLPLLNEWKLGRPRITSADIALDPRIAALIAEQITTASVQAAKSAEEKAADVLADAEAVAEAGRDAEAKAAALQQDLQEATAQLQAKNRALEDLAAERARDAQIALEKLTTLKAQFDSERQRADQAVQTVAKDEVRLQAIPKLEEQVKRLGQVDQHAAVLTAKLDDAVAKIEDLRQRLAATEKAANDAREAMAKGSKEAEQARISEQSALVRLDAAVRELESNTALLIEAKEDAKAARKEAKELQAQLLGKSS